MKRIFLFIVIATLFAFAIVPVYGASIKGEEMVSAPAKVSASAPVFAGSEIIPPPPGATKEDVRAIVNGVIKEVGGLKKETKNLRNDLVGKEGAIPTLNKSTRDLAKATSEIAKATKSNTEAIDGLGAAVDNAQSQVVSCIKNNSWLFGIILAFVFIIMLFLYYRNRKQNIRIWNPVAQTVSDTAHEVKNISKAVKETNEKIDNIAKTIMEVPTETARIVKEFDSKPFEFDVAGHHVAYTSPAEGIAEGYYKTIQVTEMPDGKDHPESFERQMETKRGIAKNYIAGMVKKYLEGKLKGKPEETLIDYLKSTGELKIEKIS